MGARRRRPPRSPARGRIPRAFRRQKLPPGRAVTLRERVAGAAVAAARPLLPLLGLRSRRLARAVAERKGVAGRLAAWASEGRDPGRPVVWLHGASAGELAGAAPTVERLRERRDVQLVASYFSPSAEDALPLLEPDAAEPLPTDALRPCRRALEAAGPDAVVFAKGDLWPNFTRAAAGLGIPLALVNGTVAPDSSRLRGPARWLLRPAHRRLARAGAASEADARRLRQLGVRQEALAVTGDAAFDQALARARRAREDPDSPAARLRAMVAGDDVPVLVAGSTWPPDEEALISAAAALAAEGRPLRLVLAPHEPTDAAVGRIARRCREALGRAPVVWSRAEEDGSRATRGGGPDGGGSGSDRESGAAGAPDPDAAPPLPRPVLVDVIGPLAELYAAADLAWVGGGFGREGLHSVIEPAAAGVPVLFGPVSTRREAEALRAAGGSRAVPEGELAGALRELVDHPERRREMGEAARAAVEAEAGAAEASARLVEGLLDGAARG